VEIQFYFGEVILEVSVKEFLDKIFNFVYEISVYRFWDENTVRKACFLPL